MYLQQVVGMNHTHVRRYYTCAVTQIGVGEWSECANDLESHPLWLRLPLLLLYRY